MITAVRKWGNSLGIRIPKNLAKQLNIDEGSSIRIEIDEGNILIKKVENHYSLEEMLNKINDSNLHEEIKTSESGGQEIW